MENKGANSRPFRIWRIVLGLFGVLAFLLALNVFLSFRFAPPAGEPLVEPSVDSHFVVEPVDANGDVDYRGYLNATCSEGVTPENNALVKFVQAMGPSPDGAAVPPEFFGMLGADPPSESGRYLERLMQWAPASSEQFDAAVAEAHYEKHGVEYCDDLADFALQYPWSAETLPILDEYLQYNSHNLELIEEGLERERFFHPLVESAPQGSLATTLNFYLPSCRSMSELLQMRSNQALERNDFESAADDAFRMIRLAELYAQTDFLLDQLLVTGIYVRGLQQVQRIATHPKISSADLLYIKARLAERSCPVNIARAMRRGSRVMFLDSAQYVLRHGKDPLVNGDNVDSPFNSLGNALRFVDPGVFMRTINEQASGLVAICDGETTLDRIALAKEFDERFSQQLDADSNIARLVASSFLGREKRSRRYARILAGMLMPPATQVFESQGAAESQRDMLAIVIDLRLYRIKHGAYPDKLSELSLGPELGTDSITGQQFCYLASADSFTLYCLGADGLDQGGVEAAGGDDFELRQFEGCSWDEFLARPDR